jgi:hypothetical protein
VGSIHYDPTFHPADYVEGVDLIRAAGPNGFNARFHAIEDDLAQFSAVVADVEAALIAVASGPTEHALWFPPRLQPVTGAAPWRLSATGAAQDTGGTSPSGAFNLVLPDGVRLESLRAIGQTSGGIDVTVTLSRCAYGAATAQVLSTMTVGANPFDTTIPVEEALARVQTGSFRYFITASAPVTPADAPSVVIGAIQLAYSTAPERRQP